MSKSESGVVLVTGGAGYIGSVLVRKLLDRGYRVRIVDRLIFGDKSIKEIRKNIDLIIADIRNIPLKALKDVFAIIHLAGFSTDPTSQYDPRLTDMINHIATENLAKMARSLGIKRFIYASTCSVYFTLNTPLDPPFYKETEHVNPISSYSFTKRCSEQVLWAMTNNDFQPTILRKGTLYGLSPRMRYDLVFNSFAKDAYFKKLLTVDAAGEIWRPMIDIADMVEVYVKCLELPLSKIGGKIFNVADKNWKIGDLAREIKEIIKKEKSMKIKLDIKPFGVARNYKADNSLFVKTFDFKPKRTLSDALFEIWDVFKKNPRYNPQKTIYYGDLWYQKFFKTGEGKQFKKHV